jgi:hypothetical protein
LGSAEPSFVCRCSSGYSASSPWKPVVLNKAVSLIVVAAALLLGLLLVAHEPNTAGQPRPAGFERHASH